MHEIIFLMGKSSSGKNKVYKALVDDTGLNLKTVVMYTTRPMRHNEAEGVDYFFVDDEEAKKMVDENKVIEIREYETVYGIWKYFTADDGQIVLERKDDRFIIIGTLEAYLKFCEFYGKEHILPIYIEVDDGIRLTRALEREKKQAQPKYAEMCRRFLADSEDFSEENIRNAGIEKRYLNNDSLEECISEIRKDILKTVSENTI